jgi:hypothetical protein
VSKSARKGEWREVLASVISIGRYAFTGSDGRATPTDQSVMPLRILLGMAVISSFVSCQRPTGLDGYAPVIPAAGSLTARMDAAEILSARIEGDRLRLEVAHAAGCSDHDFALLHDGGFLESHPVQTHIRLAHDAHGEMCRALAMPVLYFDLSPLEELYRESYRTGGAIVIHLWGPGATGPVAPPLLYEF